MIQRTNIRLRSKEEIMQMMQTPREPSLQSPLTFENVFKKDFGNEEYDLE